MEFDTNTEYTDNIITDEQRTAASTHKITLQPLHSNIVNEGAVIKSAEVASIASSNADNETQLTFGQYKLISTDKSHTKTITVVIVSVCVVAIGTLVYLITKLA